VGHEGIAAFWDFAHQDKARELTPEVNRIVVCANEGILDFTMKVRIRHLNQGLDLRVVDRFVLNDQGKIQSANAYWDESSASAPPTARNSDTRPPAPSLRAQRSNPELAPPAPISGLTPGLLRLRLAMSHEKGFEK
jgi:hypothetical protein